MYMAHSCHGAAGAVAMFDVAKTVGLWRHPADAASIFLQYKMKQQLSKAKTKLQKNKQQQQQRPDSGASVASLSSSSTSKSLAAASKAAAPAAAAGGKTAGQQLRLMTYGSVASDNASLIGTAASSAAAAAAGGASMHGSDASLPCSSHIGCSGSSNRSVDSAAAVAASDSSSIDSFYSSCGVDGSAVE
jgi:hypothetical protein